MTDIVKEEKTEQETVFMRTVIKKSVYDRLRDFAQRYSTGRGNWDFGVAAEILLDFYEQAQIGILSDKMDMILHQVSNHCEPEVPVEEEKFEEFLGGHKEKVE